MGQADLRSGDPTMVDYTPGSAVVGGDVVILGNTAGLTCGVVHYDIPANTFGQVAVGGGVYECLNLNNAANYAKVWWDNALDRVTTVSTNNALFGFVVGRGGGGVNSACDVLHSPLV